MPVTSFSVADEAQLNAAIASVNTGGVNAAAGTTYSIVLTSDFSLNSDITAINLIAGDTLDITGNTLATGGNPTAQLDGGGSSRGFVVLSGTVGLDSLGILATVATGGNGHAGAMAGGGGAGLGGAIFVGAGATVEVSNVNYGGNAVRGGNAGAVGGAAGSVGAGGTGEPGGFGAGGAGGSAGGFGGGGGSGAAGGFGGGANAGGGLAAGGTIFVAQGATFIATNGGAIAAGGLAGGSGSGGAGGAYGSGVFIQGNNSITLGNITVSGVIADQSGSGGVAANAGAGSVIVEGAATLSAKNTYTGGTQIVGGALSLEAVGAAGGGAITFAAGAAATGAELAIGLGDAPQNTISGYVFGDVIDLQGIGTAASATLLAGNHLLVQGGRGGPVTLNLDPAQSHANDIFLVAGDGAATAGSKITVLQNQFSVASESDLNTVLGEIDAGGQYARSNVKYTITFAAGFTLTSDLYAINLSSGDTLTIAGAGQTLDGGGAHRGWLVYSGAVKINNLTIQNAVASGGAGGAGSLAGGGGAGLGGGLFVASGAAVTLSNVSFLNDSAVGGAGGLVSGSGAGGGGGLGGAGGASYGGSYAGGGGGVGLTAVGGFHGGGGAGILLGAGGGGSGTGAGAGGGGANGGGGGSAGVFSGSGRDPRSFPGAAGTGGVAANGRFGGGAGAGALAGFGGGGAADDGASGGNAQSGAGGFGGGGAGGLGGGFGAGAGTATGGGGGLGAGGGVFVQQGGSLTISSGGVSGGAVSGGAGSGGAGAGQGLGAGLFLQGAGHVSFSPAAGQSVTLSSAIADQAGAGGAGSLTMTGAGTLNLETANSFSGGLTILAGVVSLDAAGAAGSGSITFGYGSTAILTVAPGALPSNIIRGFLPGDSIDLRGIGAATSALLGAKAVLAITGGGVNVTLNLDSNQIFTGETFVAQSDGAGGTLLTAVDVAGDRPPHIAGGGAKVSGNDATPLTPLSALIVTDLDVGQTETATVTLSSKANGGLSNLAGGTYNTATGVYAVSGSAAAVTAALDGLVFTPVDHEVAPGQSVSTIFSVNVTDGLMSAQAKDTATVTALNTPPTITGAGGYNTDGYWTLPYTVFAGVTVADPDVAATETVTLTLADSASPGYATDSNGALSLAGPVAGVSLTHTALGTYTLTAASPAAVTQALDAIAFTPISHGAGSGFTITYLGISVTDGAATATASETLLAGAPVIKGVLTGQAVSDAQAVNPFSTVSLTDSPGVASLTVTILVTLPDGVTNTDANGILSGPGLTKTGVGVYTLTAGSPAAVTAAVEALTFTPTYHEVALGQTVTTNFTLSVFDGASTTDNGFTSVVATSTGATVVWAGPNPTSRGGVWNTATDWSTGAPPAATDTASLSNGGVYIVTMEQNNTVTNLVISDSNATLAINAGVTLTLAGGGAASLSRGAITLASGAALVVGGAFANNGGKLEAFAGSAIDLRGAAISGGTAAIAAGAAIFAQGGAGASTISGATVTNLGVIESDAGASLTIVGAVSNTGSLNANQGALAITGAVTGVGGETISGGSLELGGAVASTQTVTFASGVVGALSLDQAHNFAGTVAGLATGDTIDLTSFQFSGAPTVASVVGTGAVGSTMAVNVKDGTATATIHLMVQYAGQYSTSASAYALTSDHPGSASAGTLFQLAPGH